MKSRATTINLETEQLIIRDYSSTDFRAYYNLMSHSETMYYLPGIKVDTEKEAELKFTKLLEDQANKNRQFYYFHIELKETHEQLGRE